MFEDKVKITNNTGGAVTDVRYVRVMDWDVPFTEFDDVVTIIGTATTVDLEFSNDNGFSSSDPLAGADPEIAPGTTNVDFVDSETATDYDHGAYFRFNFGDLADGESLEFSVFYGAAPTEAGMLAALSAASVELYSLGQSFPPTGDPVLGTPITYAFGFSGVGGIIVVPPGGVPEPVSFAVWGLLAMCTGLVCCNSRRRPSAR